MFAKSDMRVISIDNMAACIRPDIAAFQVTLDRMQCAVEAVLLAPGVEQKDFAKVRTLLRDGSPIYEGMRFDIGIKGSCEIQQGFMDLLMSAEMKQLVDDDMFVKCKAYGSHAHVLFLQHMATHTHIHTHTYAHAR